MKQFRDLYLQLNGHNIEEVVNAIDAATYRSWARAHELENELANDSLLPGEAPPYCFRLSPGSGLVGANLWLFKKSADLWYVSNVVPIEAGQLVKDEYNKILVDFSETVLKPAISGTTAAVTISEDEVFIRDIADDEVERALKVFSSAANKSTGSTHPSDRERWFTFLIAASQYPDLNYDLIVDTLMTQDWSEDTAHELGSEFNFAKDLLVYSRHRS